MQSLFSTNTAISFPCHIRQGLVWETQIIQLNKSVAGQSRAFILVTTILGLDLELLPNDLLYVCLSPDAELGLLPLSKRKTKHLPFFSYTALKLQSPSIPGFKVEALGKLWKDLCHALISTKQLILGMREVAGRGRRGKWIH